MRALGLAVVLFAPVMAAAQFKCVDSAGKVSFQQAPCPTSQKQQTLDVRAAPAPVAATGAAAPTDTADQRILRGLLRERRIRELEFAIQQTETNMNARGGQMSAEIQALQARKARANNNLAGATLEQAISTEMQAVAAKYKALNDIDAENLRQLRAELGETRRSDGGQPGR